MYREMLVRFKLKKIHSNMMFIWVLVMFNENWMYDAMEVRWVVKNALEACNGFFEVIFQKLLEQMLTRPTDRLDKRDYSKIFRYNC